MVFSRRPRFLGKQNMEGIFTEEAEDVKEQGFTEYSGKWEYGAWGREVGDWAKKKKRRAVTWGWENWQRYIQGGNRSNQDVRLVSWVLLVMGCLRINLVFPWGWAVRHAQCTQLQPDWMIPPGGSSLVCGRLRVLWKESAVHSWGTRGKAQGTSR